MTWLHRLLRRNKVEEQLRKELQFHIDEHSAELISNGMDPKDAAVSARLLLGGPEQVKEYCRDARGTRWLEDLFRDCRFAARTLRRSPGFAAVAILTLALGIGATSVMFTIVNGVVLKPLPFRQPEELVALRERSQQSGSQWGFSYPSFIDARQQSTTLALAAWTYGGGTISSPGEPAYVNGRQISAEVFPVLGASVSQGRAFLAEEDRPGAMPVIMISTALLQRLFAGRSEAVGSQIVFEGKPWTVVGVIPRGLKLDGDADVFTPLGQVTEPRMANRGARFLHVLGRRRQGVTLLAAGSELSLISRQRAKQYPLFNEGRDIVALPLLSESIGDAAATLWLLLGAVTVVLLIACVNLASLLLARAVSRQRELAVRLALGAGRGRLLRQCLTETGLLGVLGGAAGALLAAISLRPLLALWPGDLPRVEDVGVDWRVLLFTAGISLVSGLSFGIAPALRTPLDNLEERLRAGTRSSSGNSSRLHGGFVIAEISLAFILLVSAGMFLRTVLYLSNLSPGIDIHNAFAARVAISPSSLATPEKVRAAWRDVLDRARQTPGVESVALADIIPMREGENVLDYRPRAEALPSNQEPAALASTVTPDYLKVMGIPLKRGRFFDDRDRKGSPLVIVIDDLLAVHAFGAADPIGRQLSVPAISDGPVQVIGVVGHVRHWGLAADDQSSVRDQMYYPFAQLPDRLLHFFSSVMSVAVRTSATPSSVVEVLRRNVREGAGDQVLYDVYTMEQLASDSLSRQRFLLMLFAIFAGLALTMAGIGIYGVLVYLTTQRVPEIGVRIALGARASQVTWLVLRQSLTMIVAGIFAGSGAALGTGLVLRHYVEGMQPAQSSTFAAMTVVLISAGLAASFVPAYRASRIDPMKALRQE